MTTLYTCPVCAYSQMPYPADEGKICPCCGTEFGYDDDLGVTYRELRDRWVERRTPWFSPVDERPQPDWSGIAQLVASDYEFTPPSWWQPDPAPVHVQLEGSLIRSLELLPAALERLGQVASVEASVTDSRCDEPSVLGAGGGVATVPTKTEAEAVWRAAYIARMVERGVHIADAAACCHAIDVNLSASPGDEADAELDYWGSDGGGEGEAPRRCGPE